MSAIVSAWSRPIQPVLDFSCNSALVQAPAKLSHATSKLDSADLFPTPGDLVCPITQELFVEPVINAAGQVYERNAIEAYLKLKQVDPVTNLPLASTQLTAVHLVRGRALEHRERTARECLEMVLSGSCRDPAAYLRRAAELCAPVASLKMPGLDQEVIEYIMSHHSNVYSTLVLEKFAEGLRRAGLIDKATQLYLRLLELSEGDRMLQSRALRSCVACWGNEHGQPDKEPVLLRLAAFLESQSKLGAVQVVDIMLETQELEPLAMQLCEYLLAKQEAGPSSMGSDKPATQLPNNTNGLLMRYVQLRFAALETQLQSAASSHTAGTSKGSSHGGVEQEEGQGLSHLELCGAASQAVRTHPLHKLHRIARFLRQRQRSIASGALAVLSWFGGTHPVLRTANVGMLLYLLNAPKKAE